MLALAVYVPLLVLFLVAPISFFQRGDVSTKHDSWEGALYYALTIALFSLGAVVGAALARPSEQRERAGDGMLHASRELVRRICTVALVLALAAYAVWLTLAIVRAGGPLELLEAYGADPSRVQHVYFATIAGLTTLTQLAIAAVALVVAYGLVRRRSAGALVALAVLAAATVSVLGSQRLAAIELVLPIAYLLVAERTMTPTRLAVALAGLVLGVVAFFVALEIARTGAYTSFSFGDAVDRFLAYYIGSVNNSFALAEHYSLATPLYFSTQAIWEFPGAAHFGVTYERVFGIDAPTVYADFFRANGITPKVNTFGLPGEAAADFGWAALLWILGLGGVVGAVYQAGKRKLFYRALYAVWIVGILDFVRIDYFLATRIVPAYLVFALTFVLVERRSSGRA